MLPLSDKSLMLGGTEADPVSHHYVVSLVFTVLFVLQNGRDVYYVLYSIKIISLKALDESYKNHIGFAMLRASGEEQCLPTSDPI